ncbi:MAG: alpha/beta hydrolase [Hyphomicrobiales bacterium]|nr:MAG: alpha/beta hydrolase [Hyphomicrobiales bacterium]
MASASDAAVAPRLFASVSEATGEGRDKAPVVFLHGFAGKHSTYDTVRGVIGGQRTTIAFDLPGHGGSRPWPQTGNAGVAAKAVLNELSERGLERVHLVGHSMGGATAALVAMRAPERMASLTLLAPGGFGAEINQRLLRRYAVAREAGELKLLMEQFFGWRRPLPDGLIEDMVAERADPEATESFGMIVEEILDGEVQKVLPRRDIAKLGCPVKVVWGTQDRVLPTRQAHHLPGEVAVHIFDEVGHMPHLEVPEAVAGLILQNAAGE